MPAHSAELLSQRGTAEVRGTYADAVAESRPTELVRVNSDAARGIGLASLGTACLQRIFSNPELLLESAKVWLKNEPDHRVALIEMSSGLAATTTSDAKWCCKESISHRWWVALIARFFTLRAHNAFQQGFLLRQARISTPQPLAVVTVNRGRTYHEYLLTEAVSGAVSLEQWVSRLTCRENTDACRQERRIIARQLGSQLQRLHEQRFDHRDLKPSNILLSDPACVWLIDLDGVWRWPVLPRSRRVQNLARLWAGLAGRPAVTGTDALRFLLAYLSPAQRGEWKTLWRQIVRRAWKKITQKRSRTATFSTSLSLPANGSATRNR